MKSTSLRNKLNKETPVIGTWHTLASPLLAEAQARAGFDFVIIDFEHGPYELDRVSVYVNACERYGASPIVRIPEMRPWMVQQVLDQGAGGVIIPHIESADEVRVFVRAAKFSPKGDRGFSPYTKAAGFSNSQAKAYTQKKNQDTVLGIIIESREGFAALNEIIRVEGLDIVYFGAYDLSAVMGHPGEIWHPRVVRTIREGIRLVNQAGKTAGGFIPKSKTEVNRVLDMGIRFITYEVDSHLIVEPSKRITDWMHQKK